MLKGRLMTCPGHVRLIVHEPVSTEGLEPTVEAGEGPCCQGAGAIVVGRRRRSGRPRMISLAPELRGIVGPGVLAFDAVKVVERAAALDAPMAEAERRVRVETPAERSDVRAMYKAVGLDPTKRRPSSEALLRRVLRGDPLPRINSLVDVCNWCSLEFQLPYGLYDLDHVHGLIQLRLGCEGEEYAGIRKDAVHVAGRLTLVDDGGPFGNPSSDSARTMVVPGATRVMVVVYAPARLAQSHLGAVLEMTSRRVGEIAGGRETHRIILDR